MLGDGVYWHVCMCAQMCFHMSRGMLHTCVEMHLQDCAGMFSHVWRGLHSFAWVQDVFACAFFFLCVCTGVFARECGDGLLRYDCAFELSLHCFMERWSPK